MATVTCTADAAITTAGTGAAVTTSTAITDRFSLDSRSPPIARATRMAAMRTGRATEARPVQQGTQKRSAPTSTRSAELHLHRDADQIRMVLGAELLLEQRGGVGHRLVGNLQRIGDFDDLVATAEQPQDFQFARSHLRCRIGLDRSA